MIKNAINSNRATLACLFEISVCDRQCMKNAVLPLPAGWKLVFPTISKQIAEDNPLGKLITNASPHMCTQISTDFHSNPLNAAAQTQIGISNSIIIAISSPRKIPQPVSVPVRPQN